MITTYHIQQSYSTLAEANALFREVWAGTKRREPAQPQRLRWQIRGLGAEPTNKLFAKSSRFALLATMLRGRFQESMEPCSRKKEISFCENFWAGKPNKTVISGNLTDAKMSAKPYAATLSEVFKT